MSNHAYPEEFPIAEVRELVGMLRGEWRSSVPGIANRVWWLEGWALGKFLGRPSGIVFGDAVSLDGEEQLALEELRREAEMQMFGAAAETSARSFNVVFVLELVRMVLALLRQGATGE